jgi:hypothetical protein
VIRQIAKATRAEKRLRIVARPAVIDEQQTKSRHEIDMAHERHDEVRADGQAQRRFTDVLLRPKRSVIWRVDISWRASLTRRAMNEAAASDGLHASSKVETTPPRRVLHIEYAESLAIADGLQIAIA